MAKKKAQVREATVYLKHQLKAGVEAKLVLNQMLRHSLEILQMPQLELAALIAKEIDQNPLLELESEIFLLPPSYIPLEPSAKPSLYEHLRAQIREAFLQEEPLVEEMVSHLDERGLLSVSLQELSALFRVSIDRLEKILAVLQTFDPPGIFSRNVQEAFSIQLQRQGQTKTVAFRLVRDAFEDFLQGRYAAVKRKLQVSEPALSAAIQQLARLSTRPGALFQTEPPQPIYPDLQIGWEGSHWMVEPGEEALPKFRIKTQYLHLPSLSRAQKETIRTFATSARWLSRSIQRRRKLLLAIGMYVIRHRADYFEGKGSLTPIPAAELAIECGVHPSTISRAILNKYIEGPPGLMPLRAFVSSCSNNAAKDLLFSMISREETPLTDNQLMEKMHQAGHPIARRTITKYRKQLKISSSSIRKHTLDRPYSHLKVVR